MNCYDFTFCGARLKALGSGALCWPGESLLVVSDLHLGKSERRARLGEAPLPPYETRDTLDRLERDLRMAKPATVICLGDSFDDNQAAMALPEPEKLRINALQAGRRWIWIEGNHDPGPVGLGGSHRLDVTRGRSDLSPHSLTWKELEKFQGITTQSLPCQHAAARYPARLFWLMNSASSCPPMAPIPAGCAAATAPCNRSCGRARLRS